MQCGGWFQQRFAIAFVRCFQGISYIGPSRVRSNARFAAVVRRKQIKLDSPAAAGDSRSANLGNPIALNVTVAAYLVLSSLTSVGVSSRWRQAGEYVDVSSRRGVQHVSVVELDPIRGVLIVPRHGSVKVRVLILLLFGVRRMHEISQTSYK